MNRARRTHCPTAIAIRSLAADDLDGVFALYGAVFGAEALERFRRRWRWQFFENPANECAASRMWVARRDGAIVGFLASFPTRLHVAGEEVIIHHDCDLIVSPDTRRMGVGERLVRAYDECPNPLSNALAYAAANGRIRGRVGYRPVHAVPVYYRPLRMGPVLAFAAGSPTAPAPLRRPPATWLRHAAALAMNGAVLAAGRVRMPRPARGWTVESLTAARGEFDELWRRLRPHYPIAAVRDRRFVQWRFLDDPVFRHTVLLAREPGGRPAGYLALRVTPRDRLRMGRIMDLFCDPGSVLAVDALLHAALAQFRSASADVISCLGLRPELRRVVQRYLYVRPARLDHPAWMLWKGNGIARELVYDAAQWHLSYADSDIGFGP
jgi:predicted N-acetyltransferase YhbS